MTPEAANRLGSAASLPYFFHHHTTRPIFSGRYGPYPADSPEIPPTPTPQFKINGDAHQVLN